jgi:3',5'-cyclic AMP phosphodiesterase CpdA
MTTILQISDTHIAPKGVLVSNSLDTSASLEKLVIRLNEKRSQFGVIDCVLVSGDISEDGSVESYNRFKKILAPLDLPVFVIPGNHDLRDPMRNAFMKDGIFPKMGNLNWHKKVGKVHLLGLDSLIEGKGSGVLTPDTLQYLNDTLNKIKSEPVLLALHHPPFKSGIKFLDEIGLKNIDMFVRIISKFTGEMRIVCGHIHTMMMIGINKHMVVSAPSSCSSFAYDTRSNAPVGFMDVEGGCLLHRWNDGFKTVRIGPTCGSGPFPF